MKVVEISPQNALNCTILNKFLGGGACPQTPLAKARSFAARDMPLRGMYIENTRNFKVYPAYAPELSRHMNSNMYYYVSLCIDTIVERMTLAHEYLTL